MSIMDNNGLDNSQSVLSVLPELVWKLILDEMDDSRVTENVLHAFPELSELFHKRKPVWFFDQILPHLNKDGDRDEKKMLIMSCQNVCKRWTSVTDSFVQNHPSHLPYNHQGITRRSAPYREFSYDVQVHHHRHFYFYSTQKLLRFHDAMKNHPRDPFQGGWVTLAINKPEPHIHEFLDAALLFLQTFGKPIKTFSLNLPCFVSDVPSSRRILSKILSCLSYLESAHYLYINFDLNLGELSDADLERVLPQVLHFETIRIGNEISPKVKRILLNWLATVKKLIALKEFPMNFQWLNVRNIVELQMILFRNTLTANLNAAIPFFPQLKTLSITILDSGPPSLDVASLFNLLASLQLEELILQGLPFRDKGYSTTEIPQFPTLKYLQITDHPDQTLNFLKAFSSLEHLAIESSRVVNQIGNEERLRTSTYRLTWMRPTTLTSTLRYYVYEPVVPSTVNIWNKIPSLKLLTTMMRGICKIQFAKECGNKPFYSYLFHRSNN